MFELIQAGEKTYYINSHDIMGIYCLNEKEVCVIDTGDGKASAAAVQEILNERGWSLKFIINTHTHIDHLGGNAYLMEEWKCPAYATNVDNAFANHKTLEVSYMFGGYPCEELRRIFAHPGPLGFRDIENFALPEGLQWIRLPGHSFGMIGIKTSDDVWFIGDSLLSRKALEKYQFGYLVDVEGYLETLRLLKTLEGRLFIPAHGRAETDIRALAEENERNINRNLEVVLELCGGGKNFDLILKEIFDRYGIAPRMAQYALVGSTLRCYLTCLQDRGKVDCYFKENILFWQTVQ